MVAAAVALEARGCLYDVLERFCSGSKRIAMAFQRSSTLTGCSMNLRHGQTGDINEVL